MEAVQNAPKEQPLQGSMQTVTHQSGRRRHRKHKGDKGQQYREMFTQGEEAEDAGDLEKAEQCFSKCVDIFPKDPACWFNRAHVRFENNKFLESSEDYTQCLKLDPEDAHAFVNRGAAYAELGRLDEALADYDRAVCLDPADPLALFDRAEIMEIRANFMFERALREMSVALKLFEAVGEVPDYVHAAHTRLQDKLKDVWQEHILPAVAKPELPLPRKLAAEKTAERLSQILKKSSTKMQGQVQSQSEEELEGQQVSPQEGGSSQLAGGMHHKKMKTAQEQHTKGQTKGAKAGAMEERMSQQQGQQKEARSGGKFLNLRKRARMTIANP
jgi:tetratricopeptide (TPR) repeat protein